MLEFVDDGGRLVLCAPLPEAARMTLSFRIVAVTLCRGKKRLLRQLGGAAQLWDIAAVAPLQAGESLYETALGLLNEQWGITVGELREGGSHRTVWNGWPVQCAVFSAHLPKGAPPVPEGGRERLLLDSEELVGLAEQAPELLTPLLRCAIQEQWV